MWRTWKAVADAALEEVAREIDLILNGGFSWDLDWPGIRDRILDLYGVSCDEVEEEWPYSDSAEERAFFLPYIREARSMCIKLLRDPRVRDEEYGLYPVTGDMEFRPEREFWTGLWKDKS